MDLKFTSGYYDYQTTTQFYDWNTNILAANSHSTDPTLTPDEKKGSFKTAADFTKYSSLFFETSSV